MNRRKPFSSRLRVPRLRFTVPIVVLVVGGSVGGWLLTQSGASALPTYRLVPVVRTTLTQSLSSAGTLEPATTANLSFGALGQVTAVDVTVGEHVTEGQTLATMDSPTLVAQVAQAKATLSSDEARLSQDESGGASSAQVAADQAAVNADQSQVDSADTALAGATLTAPADGIIAAVGYTAGEQVGGSGGGSGSGGSGGGSDGGSDGGSGSGSGGGGSGSGGDGSGSGSGGSGSSGASDVITVVSSADVVNVSVDASVVDKIKDGDQAEITTEGANGPVSGTVASIGLTADTSSGVATFPVTIDVTGSTSGLYAGASATATIIYDQLPNVLVVPAAAVTPGPNGGSVVSVMVHGHQVQKNVTTGLTSGGLTEITGGLTAGEQVVVNIIKISGVPGQFGGPGGGFFIRGGPGGGNAKQIQINSGG
ncbi:MAG TPA: biotin/lipoyl-binding protein [Streptosporangiaceae bacterium]|nr:biotin/lipoyl-binding protein [Streptosporangiaceae bacterium]